MTLTFPEKLPEDGMLAAEIFAAAFQNARTKPHRQIKIGPNQTRAILESRRRFGPTRIPRAMVPYLDADALNSQLDAESVPPLVPEYLELPPDLCLARCKRQMIAKKGDLKRSGFGEVEIVPARNGGRRRRNRIPQGIRAAATLARAVEER